VTRGPKEREQFLKGINLICNKMGDALLNSDADIGKEITYGHGAAAIIALTRKLILAALDAQFEDIIDKNF